MPCHLIGGEHDGVIPASNVVRHYEAMRAAGMDVSFRLMTGGHMDFTLSSSEELTYYVQSLLTRK